MTVRDDLIAARALIDTPEKWCRHVAWDDTGAHCAMGACNVVSGGRTERFAAMGSALQLVLPEMWCFVPDFNDDAAIDHSDIMALFDRAIASPAGAAMRLTTVELATLKEMRAYPTYYPFRHATCARLVEKGLAAVVLNDRRKRPAHCLTDAGRKALQETP